MWFFETPENYNKMIEKISKSVFAISLLMLYFISCINDEFKMFFEKISFGAIYKIGDLELNLALFYLPIVMGVLEHLFKVHDKVASLLRIRENYDKYIIMSEICKRLKLEVKLDNYSKNDVKRIMSQVFYKYVSSTNPEIDSHYVTMTLNEWCWFWIMLDTKILLFIVGIVFLVFNWSWLNLLLVVVCYILLATFLVLILFQTISYTKKEIDVILSDTKRMNEIKKVFEDAL